MFRVRDGDDLPVARVYLAALSQKRERPAHASVAVAERMDAHKNECEYVSAPPL